MVPSGSRPNFISEVSTPITGICRRTGSDLLRCGVSTVGAASGCVEVKEQAVSRATHVVATKSRRRALIAVP